ncbi:MAG: glutamate 5-kinase [Dehalococcoidales bacterium]
MGSRGEKTRKTGSPYRRIVIKLGTSLLTGGGDCLDEEMMSRLVEQVARLQAQGVELILVSSGAIASGRHKLGLTKSIKGIPFKQVLAAVGQSGLMHTYERLFGKYNVTVAQALLTKSDLADRHGYLNARNTLLALMELGVVCVVNENDVVSIDEIKEAKFGDNDNLSAMVANLVDADMLIMLTDIGGLYTADPHVDPSARLIPEVRKIDSGIKRLGAAPSSNLGTGGMVTKIEAAEKATDAGVRVVFACGREPDIILRLASGEPLGTHFLPTSTKIESRKRWMISGLCTRGKLVVDAGAAQALKKQNRSLLAAGILKAEGRFGRGEIVAIYDTDGTQLGCGIANYSSGDIGIIKGARSEKIAGLLSVDYGPEVVHRNNLALVEREEPGEHRQTVPGH